MIGDNYTRFSLLAILILILIPFSSAEVRLDMSNTLTELVPYKVTLVVNEPIIQKYTNTIHIDCNRCRVMINKDDQPKENGHSSIELRGRDSVSFFIVGELDDYTNKDATGTVSSIKFRFSPDQEKLTKAFPKEGYSSSEFGVYTKYFGVIKSKKDYKLPSLPSDTKEKFVYDEFFGSYKFYDKGETWEKGPRLVRFSVLVEDLPCLRDDLYSSGEDYDPYYCGNKFNMNAIKSGETLNGIKLNKQSFLGGEGYSTASDSVHEVVTVRDDKGNKLYDLGLIFFNLHFDVFSDSKKINYEGSCEKYAYVKEGEQDAFISEAIKDCEMAINSYVRKPTGSAPSNIPKDEFKSDFASKGKPKPTIESKEICESNSDCEEEYSCTACGECKKSKYVYDTHKAEVEFKISNKLSSKSIFNTIHNRVKFESEVIPKITVDGKTIDYCDLSAPGLTDYKLVAEMKNEDSYAGFIFGWVLDERRKDETRAIDFKTRPLKYAFLVSPNERTKIVGVTGDIKEEIEFRIEKSGKEVSSSKESIVLKPIEMDIQITSSGQQVQQGGNKLVKYEVKDRTAKNIMLKGSLIGPGNIDDGKYTENYFFNNIKPGEEIKIMYYPPELGNFDIGKEIASLSMTDLQTEAAKQIAEDAFFAYTHELGQNVEDAYSAGKVASKEKAGIKAISSYFKKNPGNYDSAKAIDYVKKFSAQMNEEKLKDVVAKGYKLYTKSYVLSKVPKGTVEMRDDMSDAVSDNQNKKTYTETTAEVGVVGIDILQTGFGLLTFLPNKIPVVGKASAALQTAFSAATNIWKANLKYISKSEKIDRAEEKFIPVMILITANDESGWQQTRGYMLHVAYHEI